MTRRSSLAFALLLVFGACTAAAPSPPYVSVESSSGSRYIRVELAETEELRQRGLMRRTSLDDDAGMLFVFAEDTTSPFWMKDTPLRLTIAFISAEGEIVRVLDMEPCPADPCPVYQPGVRYRMALEVRQGALERMRIRLGDRVRLVR